MKKVFSGKDSVKDFFDWFDYGYYGVDDIVSIEVVLKKRS